MAMRGSRCFASGGDLSFNSAERNAPSYMDAIAMLLDAILLEIKGPLDGFNS